MAHRLLCGCEQSFAIILCSKYMCFSGARRSRTCPNANDNREARICRLAERKLCALNAKRKENNRIQNGMLIYLYILGMYTAYR